MLYMQGWRVIVDEGDGRRGWVLLRQSLHDPLLVVNMESELKGGRQVAAERVLHFFEAVCKGMPLDLANLHAAAQKNV